MTDYSLFHCISGEMLKVLLTSLHRLSKLKMCHRMYLKFQHLDEIKMTRKLLFRLNHKIKCHEIQKLFKKTPQN